MNAHHELNYAYTYFALSAFIFLVLNLPVPIGRLTPAASSIFNIVSSATLLSPWGAGFPFVRREGVSTSSCFFFFFFVLFFVWLFFLMFWSSLSSWALHSHTAYSSTDYSVGQICLQIETKEFCTVSHIPNIAVVVVVNCRTLKITFNRN